LPPIWPHFFTAASWSSKCTPAAPRFDHRLHELERVQHAAEPGFGVGDDGREEIDVALAFHVLDLVGAHERVVDPPHDQRHRIDRIQRLVRIHLARDVGVRRDLPAGEVDRFEPGLHLLQRLVAGERAQRVDERLVVDELPQLLGAAPSERVLDVDRAPETNDVFLPSNPDGCPSSAGSPPSPS
jgi:hypothetical protein